MAHRRSPTCCSLAHTMFSEQFLKHVSSPASPRLHAWESKLEQCKEELGECSMLLHLYLAAEMNPVTLGFYFHVSIVSYIFSFFPWK